MSDQINRKKDEIYRLLTETIPVHEVIIAHIKYLQHMEDADKINIDDPRIQNALCHLVQILGEILSVPVLLMMAAEYGGHEIKSLNEYLQCATDELHTRGVSIEQLGERLQKQREKRHQNQKKLRIFDDTQMNSKRS